MQGKASTSNSQTITSTALNAGGSAVSVTADPTANPVLLNLNGITKNTGGTVVFTLPTGTQDGTNGVATSNAADPTGILGNWAFVSSPGTAAANTAAGYNYATVSGGNIVAYTGATVVADLNGTLSATVNYDVTGVFTVNRGVSPSLNTARILATAPVAYNANSGATNAANGYLTAGVGGTLTLGGAGAVGIGSNNELVLAAVAAPINVTAFIKDNGTNTSRLDIVGPNTVTLSGTNTYTGSTNVNGGTLVVAGSGAINTSSGININGANAKFVQTSSVASTPAISVKQGTLDGTGTVGDVTVANGNGGIVSNGNGGTGVLTIGNLTFQGTGAADVRYGGSAGIVVSGALTTTPAGGAQKVTINASGTGTSDPPIT